jgi:hypothetical protein
MMRGNPLVTETLVGVTRTGSAQLDHLGLLVVQAAVLFVLWPKGDVTELLTSQHSPYTLAGLMMALGLGMAYIALRAGAEVSLLPGQHGLRDWALATPLGLGRVLRGYVAGQVVHSVYLVALSSPLLLMAFTVAGGEWPALGWCAGAALAQALFYRLCGALTHLLLGQHRTETVYAIRTLLAVIYLPIGWIAPVTSHLALSYRTLAKSLPASPLVEDAPDPVTFLGIYAALSVLAGLAVHRLLLRERRRMAQPPDRAGLEEAVT